MAKYIDMEANVNTTITATFGGKEANKPATSDGKKLNSNEKKEN